VKWRVTSRLLFQIKTLRATGFFKSASGSQFVCIKHRVSMYFKSSLMGFLFSNFFIFLSIKAELFQMVLYWRYKYKYWRYK